MSESKAKAVSLLDQFGVDLDLAESGVRHDFGHGRWMRLAHMHESNKRYTRALMRAAKRHKYLLDENQPDTDDARAAMAAVMADSIVLDWGGVWAVDASAEDGDTPFTRENVIAVLTDPRLKHFFSAVIQAAQNRASFAPKVASEEAVGN